MKNQSNMTKALLAAAAQVSKPTIVKDNRQAAANAFLYKARHSSVAAPPKQNVADKIDHLIKAEDRFPDHHPAEMKKEGESTRFFFKHTKDSRVYSKRTPSMYSTAIAMKPSIHACKST